MKNALITSDYFENAHYTLIESMEDFKMYVEKMNESLAESIGRIMRSGVDISKIDHILRRDNLGDAILTGSFMECSVNGGNPLLNSSTSLQLRIDGMLGILLDGQIVAVNHVGGYCPLSDDWIVEYVDSFEEESNYFISEEASFMNLENDPELEERTKEYFKENDYKLSYIIRLRSFKYHDLVDVFKQFKSKGGYGLYVYTTGIDVTQMYTYSKAAIAAELNEVVFEFNAGISVEILEVIQYLKDHGIGVTYYEA